MKPTECLEDVYESYKTHEAEEMCSTLVVNCVFNAFLSYTTIMLNIISIQALRKTSSLSKPLKTLLLSLAVSDLGVGLLVQPLYIVRMRVLMPDIQQNAIHNGTYQKIYILHFIFGNLFCTASFLGVVALAVDRFLAIHLHLRYQDFVTCKRVVAIVISAWVLSIFLPLFALNSFFIDILVTIYAAIWIVSLLCTALLYCKIYTAIRRHRNQIQVLETQLEPQNGEISNTARLRKTVLGTLYVYVVFLTCYLPYLCVKAATIISGETVVLAHLFYYVTTLLFVNSSLNPLIYCWKMRNVRKAVMDILRNIFPS